MTTTVNVLYLPGTNCQTETMAAFHRVGAQPRLLFISDVMSGAEQLDNADILCMPGGFSFGDHLGAGAVAGLLLRTKLRDQFERCQRRPLIAICNGFQIAVRAGCFGPDVDLRVNDSGTFLSRPDQPHETVAGNGSPWLRGLEGRVMEFPCAHGEGRFVHRDESSADRPWASALRYPPGENPDGSMDDIAGITSPNGLVLGLMNHPERARDHEVRLVMFENGVRAAQ